MSPVNLVFSSGGAQIILLHPPHRLATLISCSVAPPPKPRNPAPHTLYRPSPPPPRRPSRCRRASPLRARPRAPATPPSAHSIGRWVWPSGFMLACSPCRWEDLRFSADFPHRLLFKVGTLPPPGGGRVSPAGPPFLGSFFRVEKIC